ncbi:substrate-binding domain-containing protein [Sorangium atrum]|uniref:Substrate-binding domain-containing protein n=1 Tax=Sorangium atrum TaxID=2995308 RepID=A0ABT5BYW1_9BACT|nr:substrate-binding domain-containing protein [Sorangium aterium]MDC0678142.1 substrate-binding domain-containing protein [Sorangium aterium]
MTTGLDVFSTLHDLVRRAMEGLPGARRGSLLIRTGRRLSYRAIVGLDGLLAGQGNMPSDGGVLSESAPFGPAAAPEAAHGPCLVPAAAWYRAHLPELAEAPGWPLDGVHVHVVPVPMFGAPGAYLALEQPDAAPLSGPWRALVESIAVSVGVVLERRGLFKEKAQSAQELRLLEEVLSSVAESVDLLQLIETLADGIRSVQTGPRWSAIDLVILEDAGGEGRVADGWRGSHDAGGARGQPMIRVYKAPRRPLTAYWNNLRDGALAAGRDLRVGVEFRSVMSAAAAAQEALLEEGIRRRVDGIAIAPIDPVALEPAIDRAMAAGIPVITIDTPAAPGSRSLLYVGTDNRAAGRIAGEAMLRLMPQGGEITVQAESFAVPNAQGRIEGLREAIAGSSVRVASLSENLFNVESAIALAVDVVRSNPGLAGALGVCSENGPSLGLASMRLGRAGDLKVVAFDLVTSTVAMLQDGVIHAAIVQREYDMGYRGVQALYEMATRGVPEALADLPASRCIDTGVDLVTLERTPFSSALSDHLALSSARRIANRRLGAGGRERALEFLVIGMAQRESLVDDERAPVTDDSLVGRVMRSCSSLVIDTASSEHQRFRDVAEARRSGARTLVGVPLLSREAVLGVLVLASPQPDACSATDLALIERVAAVAAVAIENARLLSRIKERTRALESLSSRQEALLETIAAMSSPVVPIARGVLVMPIVGALDTHRSGRFIEAMLKEISEHQARVVIIDVTGMAVVDASAANHLAQAARAAGLLGAEVVLVGIAPETARLMVEQGLDLGAIVTRSTLELGFSYALGKTGGRVVQGRR